jgi:D-3-phosphoglycerate dehydrogenase
MLILISDPFDEAMPKRLEAFGEVTTDHARLAEADVVLIRSRTKCTKEYIDNAPNLKMIIRGGVGIDNIDKEYAESRGIRVSNTPKASSVSVAELTFAMMLAIPNRLVEAHAGMKEGKWLKKELKRTELCGKTLCLLGIGNIASEVAKRAAAFGMKVQAYDKYVSESPLAEMKRSVEEAVSDADYISLHLPLTRETEHIFNKSVISACGRSPVVINTGRGPCVHPEHMREALESGAVSWYASDVWPSDPPPADYPLLHAPHVLMTPHIGASSRENLKRICDEACDILKEAVEEGHV